MADHGKLNHRLLFAIVASSIGSGFQHGYHLGVINVPQVIIKEFLNESYHGRTGSYVDARKADYLWGSTGAIMNLGGALGGLLIGVVAKSLGPKRSLIFNNILVLIASALMASAKSIRSFEAMIAGRLVIGVNCGLGAGLCPMYLSEIPPVNLRGAVGSVYQLVITVSILTAQILGLSFILGTYNEWPFLFVVPVFFSLFQAITLLFCPESPRYLVMKEDMAKAEASLKYLRMTDDVAAALALIKHEHETEKALPKVTVKEMFETRYLRVPLLIAVVVMLAQQFCGITAVIFYSTGTFERTGMSSNDAKYGTIGIGVLMTLMTVVSLFVVEIAGRKTLLLVGFGGMAIDTFVLAFALNYAQEHESIPYICILLAFIYIILFATGPGSIPWFLVEELFEESSSPIATSIAISVNWAANFIVALLFPVLETRMGPLVFLIFSVLTVIAVIFIIKVVPETKDRTIEDIIEQWK